MEKAGIFFVSKRFTDTLKWDKEWFQELSPVRKCLWLYVCDNADAAGVWDANFKLASFQIGDTVTEKDFQAFGDRMEKLGDRKFRIVPFLEFQYGKLSKECKAHIPVFRMLEKHSLHDRVSIPYAKPTGNGNGNGNDQQSGEILDAAGFITEKGALSQSVTAGIPPDFATFVYQDWRTREGRDGAGVKCDFIRLATKRWMREGDSWKTGTHKSKQNSSKERKETFYA